MKHKKKILFEPSWGYFDLICASEIKSVYNGPGDTMNYYASLNNTNDSYGEYNIRIKASKDIKKLNTYFKKIKQLKKIKDNTKELFSLYKKMNKNNISDWLLKYQFLEATNCNRNLEWVDTIYFDLEGQTSKKSDLSRAIKRGLNLFG